MKRHPQHILTQLDARLEAGYSKERIRKELNISRSSIYEIIDNLANWGSHYPPKGWNRKKLGPDYKMDLEQRNRLLEFLEDQPDVYLIEMQQWLYDTYNVKVSLSSISRFLKRAGWTRKKSPSKSGKRNEPFRRSFPRYQHEHVNDAEQLGFLDEAAAKERAADRRYG
ncbi:hypothetical protein BLS_002960 [Venturia inaequalis]|uniref:Winged helix-turn helix domain-containing protein n=1 Tax=Venturia inaequalis TaxID=5025 RepID=A0A8H3ZBQ1_VENIN|nr:hypothetical protein BLS_002960 [Venturia inaequalis]KAE9980798.1 hypothetical protein EG328_012047 [Venturia inaequalis]KAE9990383.1 hypothetical protein EG327_001522 [Venturia inaequalis]RDI80508.1 hypothetical protein Vi05172_g9636 [Venturia inaequalis]